VLGGGGGGGWLEGWLVWFGLVWFGLVWFGLVWFIYFTYTSSSSGGGSKIFLSLLCKGLTCHPVNIFFINRSSKTSFRLQTL